MKVSIGDVGSDGSENDCMFELNTKQNARDMEIEIMFSLQNKKKLKVRR